MQGEVDEGDKEAQDTTAEAKAGIYFLLMSEPEGAQAAQEQKDSVSQDSGGKTGIAGILEGFGLLDQETEGTVEEGADTNEQGMADSKAETQTGIKSGGDPLPTEVSGRNEAVKTQGSENEWMMDDGQQEIPKDFKAKIEELTNKHLSTLENTNNKPIENTESVQMQSRDTDPDGEKPAAESDALFELPRLPFGELPKVNADGMTVSVDENAQAGGQVTEADMMDNITEIIDRISASANEGKSEFSVDLKPEFLGKLSVKLTMDSDGIKAMIKAADQTVKSLIQAEIPGLTDMLKDKGIEVRQIEVSYEAAAFDFNSQQGNSDWNTPQRQGRRMAFMPEGLEGIDAIAEAFSTLDLMAQNSSVEFRA